MNLTYYRLFIEFKDAYDSINRNRLLAVMIEFNLPLKLIRLVRMALGDVKCKVEIRTNLSREFECNTGLRQGDALS